VFHMHVALRILHQGKVLIIFHIIMQSEVETLRYVAV